LPEAATKEVTDKIFFGVQSYQFVRKQPNIPSHFYEKYGKQQHNSCHFTENVVSL